jgi:RNA polymerase sigma-70 factor (ECF subfamily)
MYVSACHVCLYRVVSFMDDAHSPDASLLARMAQRDPQALDLFYTRHTRAVFSLALTMLGDHARATDLTQDVFLLVWRSAGTYQPTGSARAWLLQLTRNRTIDELRRDRRRLASESTLPEQCFHALPAPLTLTDAAERKAVWDALGTLPAEQRDALVLAFFQGLSHQEIATCLRTPLGTIKARIRRALQTLQQQLQGEPDT